ncbi:hypothetical protein JK229_12525 [Pantoea dispersa]|uniref:hypothetical protein n=1 Tax=Pantoea dispersa TaxID=59814 RepID=UPI001BA7112C|nr:hypothetical protein [Pantoea dispersa]MBS0905953.1 hypothetical protein [Pantoea dispersa]
MKDIEEAREKVHQMFGKDGVHLFDNAIESNKNKLRIYLDDVRVVLVSLDGTPVFIFGEKLSNSA